MSGYPYEAVYFDLAPGDALMIFTDGVTDAAAPNEDLFGMEGIMKALTGDSVQTTYTAKPMVERVMKNVRAHANGKPQSDDIAVAGVSRGLDGGTSSGVKTGTATVSALKIDVRPNL
jgi:phosphoserine phosphatase RsbU/P